MKHILTSRDAFLLSLMVFLVIAAAAPRQAAAQATVQMRAEVLPVVRMQAQPAAASSEAQVSVTSLDEQRIAIRVVAGEGRERDLHLHIPLRYRLNSKTAVFRAQSSGSTNGVTLLLNPAGAAPILSRAQSLSAGADVVLGMHSAAGFSNATHEAQIEIVIPAGTEGELLLLIEGIGT